MKKANHSFIRISALLTAIIAGTTMIAIPAQAQPGGPPGPGGPGWFWAGPHHHHGPFLPDDVAWSIVAGVTYAIIDGNYYRREGPRYVYVTPPTHQPVQKVIIEHSNSSADKASTTILPGTIVDKLPNQVKKVTVNNKVYYVAGDIWYVAMANGQGYVVVPAQL